MDNTILRHEENGVEFFTIVATGESAVSERGLAKMCGVNVNAITHILASLVQQRPPKKLEKLIGEELYLTNDIYKKGKKILSIRAKIASAIIRYYAFQGREQAQDTLDAIGEIGLSSFIQGKTGWLPGEHQSSQESRQTIDRLLSEPRAYRPVFTKTLCDKGFSWYGCNFFWEYFYFWMSPSEQAYLSCVNPVVNGKRKQEIHQWIEEGMLDRIADKGHNLILLLKISSCRNQFEENHRRMYGKGFQGELHI
jgi:hypothetical protein